MAEGGALRELITLFQLGVDSKELEEGERKLQGFLGSVRKVGEVVAEAFAVHLVKDFFQEQIEGAAHVADLAERLDVSAAALNTFGVVAADAGVDFDSAAQSLGFLQKTLGEAETKGGEAAAALRRLGISAQDAAGKELPDLLGDIADGLSKLPDQNQRAAAAMAIFGRQGRALLPILSKGRGAVAGMTEEARELTAGLGDDYYAAAKAAGDESTRFGFALQTIKARVTASVLPGITKLLITMKKAAIEVIDFTKRTYVLRTAMIALAGAAGYKLLATLASLGKALGLLKPTILETVAAMIKFAAPLLIAAALYLVFDELFTLMKGGKTVIGDTLNELTGSTDAATEAAVYLNAIWSALPKVLIGIGGIVEGVVVGALVEAWDVAKLIAKTLQDISDLDFDSMKTDFAESMNEMKTDAAKFGDVITRAAGDFAGGGDEGITQARNGGASWEAILAGQRAPGGLHPDAVAAGVPGYLSNARFPKGKPGGFNVIADALGAPAPPIVAKRTRASLPGASAVAGAASAPVVNQTNTFHTTVNTTADPDRTGKAVGQGLATPLQKATNNALIAQRRP
jgi:hypothetical protein